MIYADSDSSSAKELEHYQRVRRTFEGPKVPVTGHSRIPAPKSDAHASQAAPVHQLKHKGRSINAKPTIKANGKGKATHWDSDEDDDDAYVTSNDYTTPERRDGATNGTVNGSFGDVGGNDDEDVYG